MSEQNSKLLNTANEMTLSTLNEMYDYIFHRTSIASVQKNIRNEARESEKNFILYPSLLPSDKKTILSSIEKEYILLNDHKNRIYQTIIDWPTNYTADVVKQYTELSSMIQNQKSGITIFNYLFTDIIRKLENTPDRNTNKIIYEEVLSFVSQYAAPMQIINRYVCNHGIIPFIHIWGWTHTEKLINEESNWKEPYKKEGKQWNYSWGNNKELHKSIVLYFTRLEVYQKEELEVVAWIKARDSFSLSDFHSIIQISDDMLYNNLIQRSQEMRSLEGTINRFLMVIQRQEQNTHLIKLIDFINSLLENLYESIIETNKAIQFHCFYTRSVLEVHQIVYRLQQIEREKVLLSI